jgi:hypothetical protein
MPKQHYHNINNLWCLIRAFQQFGGRTLKCLDPVTVLSPGQLRSAKNLLEDYMEALETTEAGDPENLATDIRKCLKHWMSEV